MPIQPACLALAALALAAQIVQAQSANSDAASAFEVASVKLVTLPADGRYAIGSRFDPGSYTGEYMTLDDYIQEAYPYRSGQKIVGPDWIDSRQTCYNITARASGPPQRRRNFASCCSLTDRTRM